MPAKSRQRLHVAVEIEPDYFARQTPQRRGPVRDDIWKTAMRLTGSNLKGMQVHGELCVTFPIESLTAEARRELKLK